MDSRRAAPGQFTAKTDERTAFSGPHGFVVSGIKKGAEVADVPWNVRHESIRYTYSRLRGFCQALNSGFLTPQGNQQEPALYLTMARVSRRRGTSRSEGDGLKLKAADL
jgi:hypothetical protein